MSMPQSAYLYQSIPNAIKSRSQTSRFQPTNGSKFTSNSNNVIRLEVKSDNYLTNEYYLKFGLKQNSTSSLHLDGIASAIVNRLRILCNGTVLSDIQSYNVLSQLLVATQSTDDYRRFLMSSAGASSNDVDVLAHAHTAPVGTGGAPPTAAEIATAAATNATAANAFGFNVLNPGETKFYSIPIVSGFLNSSRFIPLGLLGGSGLVIEIYLESNFATVFNAGVGGAFAGTQSYEVSDVEMVCKLVTIEDEASDARIKAMFATSGLKVKCSDWTTHYNTITKAGTASITIPDRSACLKSLTTCLVHSLPEANVSGIQTYRMDNSSYQYRIGSVMMPNQEVSVKEFNLLESLSEHLKAFNVGIFNLKTTTLIKPSTFGNNGTFTSTANYAMTYDFESYSESPDLFSGIDTATLSLPISLNMKFENVRTAAVPATINVLTFAHKDVVYNITPEGITKIE